MGVDVEDYRLGGREPLNFRKFLQGGGSRKPTVRHGVLGDVPLDLEDTGRVTPQGCQTAGKNTTEEGRLHAGGYICLWMRL